MNKRRFRQSALLILLLLSALVVGAILLHAIWHYNLNRQLIAALVKGDTGKALVLVNKGADPNIPYKSTAVPSLPALVKQWFRHSSPINKSPTAFMIACGASEATWEGGAYRDGDLCLEEVPQLVQAMAQHGAKVNAKGEDGWTPLMWAIANNYSNTVRLLLEHGADANMPDKNGDTPLTMSIELKRPVILRLLLRHGANVNAPLNDEGLTPLMLASRLRNSQSELVRLLLEHGADINAKDKHGKTALFWAVGFNVIGPGPNDEAARQLIAHGANVNLTDENGKSLLSWAEDSTSPNLVALLKKAGARK
jgi:ankyrin repeat protein